MACRKTKSYGGEVGYGPTTTTGYATEADCIAACKVCACCGGPGSLGVTTSVMVTTGVNGSYVDYQESGGLYSNCAREYSGELRYYNNPLATGDRLGYASVLVANSDNNDCRLMLSFVWPNDAQSGRVIDGVGCPLAYSWLFVPGQATYSALIYLHKFTMSGSFYSPAKPNVLRCFVTTSQESPPTPTPPEDYGPIFAPWGYFMVAFYIDVHVA